MKTQLWKIRPLNSTLASCMQARGVPALAAALLAARGFDEDAAISFLGEGEPLRDPQLLRDMDRAAAAVSEAIEDGTMICVFGDYDCDGVSATVMTVHYLQQIGARVCYYIPHREREGYGLNIPAIDDLHRLGVGLIVTVDNGVTAIAEVAHANSLGMHVVVTDHHRPGPVLPQADAVVDPHRADCPYPFKELSGVGVAFKLLCALEGERGWCLLEQYADLLAIGTVADVVQLIDENRTLVRRGLSLLAECERPGLCALMAASSVGALPTSDSIAFGLAPRINAAGRLDTAETAAMLLLTESTQEAEELAARLGELNEQRRALESVVMDDIAIQLAQDPSLACRRILILSGSGWNAGVVGIVCSRLVERFGRPCLLLAVDGDDAKGSGRSISGFSLIEAIQACASLLTHFGGHPMAAGCSLKSADIAAFANELECFAAAHYPQMPIPVFMIDCMIDPVQLTIEEVEKLGVLEPFGCGNEPPVFAVANVRLQQIVPLSGGRHAKIRLAQGQNSFWILCFSVRPEQLGLVPGDQVDVAFSASINEYHGQKSISLRCCGLRLAGMDQHALCLGRQHYEQYQRGEVADASLLPSRDEVAIVYRWLRRAGKSAMDCDDIYCHLARGTTLNYSHFRLSLDILLELGLVCRETTQNSEILSVTPGVQKVSLESSSIVRSLSKL